MGRYSYARARWSLYISRKKTRETKGRKRKGWQEEEEEEGSRGWEQAESEFLSCGDPVPARDCYVTDQHSGR